MLGFAQYLREEQEKGSLTIFDIDGTLVNSSNTAKARLMRNGQFVRHLSHEEERYQPSPGEHIDFSEFKSAKNFEASHPIHRMVAKAQAITKGIARKPQSRVIIVTARQSPDDHQRFLNTLSRHGIDTNKVHVEFAGDQTGNSDADKKKVVIDKYLKSGDFNKTRLFDDKHENLAMFKGMQGDHPNVKFEAYHAQPNGRIKTFK